MCGKEIEELKQCAIRRRKQLGKELFDNQPECEMFLFCIRFKGVVYTVEFNRKTKITEIPFLNLVFKN